MAGHENDPLPLRYCAELFCIGTRRREWLLDEQVFTRLEDRAAKPKVGGHGRCERHSIYRGIADDLIQRGQNAKRRVAVLRSLHPAHIDVTDGRELDVVEVVKDPDKVWAPVAEANDGDADAQAVPRGRTTCNGVLKSSAMSSPRDQLCAYATSRSSASPNVE